MYFTRAVLVAGAVALGWSSAAVAEPLGSEFLTTETPAAGGMAGVALVRPQDPVAMLFANPATLTQLNSNFAFTLGASYVSPELKSNGFNAFAGGSYDGESRLAQWSAPVLPSATALMRLNEKTVAGFGFTGVSGLGSDYRDVVNSSGGTVGVVSALKIFGTNLGVGYEVSPNLSVGGAFTFAIASLQVGLFSNTASVDNFGIGGQVGATYDLGPIEVAAKYSAPVSVDYKNVIQTRATGIPSDFTLEQPQGVGLGLATTDAVWKNTFLEFDANYKNYDSAEGYSSFWKDGWMFSLGAQHTVGKVSYRAGYSWHTSILKDAKDLGNNIGDIRQVAIPGAGVIPVSPGLIQLFQATAADGYWRQAVSLGLGYQAFEGMRIDVFGQYGFDGDTRVRSQDPAGVFNDLDISAEIFSAGMGITWTF